MTVSEWVAANPATVHVIVVSVIGLLSLAYNAVKDTPRVAAAIKVLSAVGVDVPKLLEGVRELLDPVKGEAKEEPKPPVGPALVVMFAAGLASTQSGCAWWSSHADDVRRAEIVACVIANAVYPDDRIKEICQVADSVWPLVAPQAQAERTRLAAARKAGAEDAAKAGVCR